MMMDYRNLFISLALTALFLAVMVKSEIKIKSVSEALRVGGWRTNSQIAKMSLKDQQNALIVEMGKHSNMGNKELQGFDKDKLIDMAIVMLLLEKQRYRTKSELTRMSFDDQRNWLIVELSKRTQKSIATLQKMCNRELGTLLDVAKITLRHTCNKESNKLRRRPKRNLDELDVIYCLFLDMRKEAIRRLGLTSAQLWPSPQEFGIGSIGMYQALLPNTYRSYAPNHVEFGLLSAIETEAEQLTEDVDNIYIWTEYSPCPECLGWIAYFLNGVRRHAPHLRNTKVVVGFNRFYYVNRAGFQNNVQQKGIGSGAEFYQMKVNRNGDMAAPDRVFP